MKAFRKIKGTNPCKHYNPDPHGSKMTTDHPTFGKGNTFKKFMRDTVRSRGKGRGF